MGDHVNVARFDGSDGPANHEENSMAVLVEGISVITRRDSIDRAFRGGWDAWLANVPNATLCTDGEVARVGFMDPKDVERFISGLVAHGLAFLKDGKAVDIAVADQQRGLTTACGWLEFANLPFGESKSPVSACWLFEGPRIASGIHMPGRSMTLATPDGWTFEGSLSQKFTFVPIGQELGGGPAQPNNLTSRETILRSPASSPMPSPCTPKQLS